MNRASFLKYFGVLAFAPVLIAKSCSAKNKYKLSFANDNASIGHLLRQKITIGEIVETKKCEVAIVGSGISALSAARALNKKGITDIRIIEMLGAIGGNATGGKNEISAFPYAAHYLPIPGLHMKELIDFLKEIELIVGEENGKPIYNMQHVCHANQERVFFDGAWQDGILPLLPYDKKATAQSNAFEKNVEELSRKKDNEGKFIFDLPNCNSSKDEEYQMLHKLSAAEWLKTNGYNAEPLIWYLNYCVSDDYGSNLENTSAWALLHYFACRKGDGVSVTKNDLLTWPEGNQYLVNEFKKIIKASIDVNEAVLKIEETENGIELFQINTTTKQWTKTIAKKVILNVPFRILKKLFSEFDTPNNKQLFRSYPWMVANISLRIPHEKSGMEISWDNVIYKAKGIGYIVAKHQSMQQETKENVFTFYKTYTDSGNDAQEREKIRAKKLEDFEKEILEDLKIVYPEIEKDILAIEIKVLGHGMIAPIPNLMTSEIFNRLQQPIRKNIILAHTDYCGISIFEESFYAGIRAVNQIYS
jgi:monoamine oxidase